MMCQIVKIISPLLLIISCFGCAGNGTRDDNTIQGRENNVKAENNRVADSDGSVTTIRIPEEASVDLPKELTSPDSKLSERSVYFSLDSFQINTEGQGLIARHSAYLNKNTKYKVMLQGHADERGSSEYNLALGQKRAEAVKNNLQLLGVAEIRLEAVSFGKEKPKNPGHNEKAWYENRRVDILYSGEF